MERILNYTITEKDAGQTIRSFLRLHGFSRHILGTMKPDPRAVLLNGSSVYMKTLLEEGDLLTVRLTDMEPSEHIIPAPIPFGILYEDEDIVIVDKPAGIAIHPAISHPADTLANGIAWYYQRKGEPYVFRCVNRLDRDTTGILVLAKNALAASVLGTNLHSDQRNTLFVRTYLAIAEGLTPPSGRIELPIARKEGSLIERCVDYEKGDQAVTHFITLGHYVRPAAPAHDSSARKPEAPAYSEEMSMDRTTDSSKEYVSLVQLQLETGRTHQIRVHMTATGHPLVGDTLYNEGGISGMPRQALHSYRLDLAHPITGEILHFISEIPDDMQEFIRGFHEISARS